MRHKYAVISGYAAFSQVWSPAKIKAFHGQANLAIGGAYHVYCSRSTFHYIAKEETQVRAYAACCALCQRDAIILRPGKVLVGNKAAVDASTGNSSITAATGITLYQYQKISAGDHREFLIQHKDIPIFGLGTRLHVIVHQGGIGNHIYPKVVLDICIKYGFQINLGGDAYIGSGIAKPAEVADIGDVACQIRIVIQSGTTLEAIVAAQREALCGSAFADGNHLGGQAFASQIHSVVIVHIDDLEGGRCFATTAGGKAQGQVYILFKTDGEREDAIINLKHIGIGSNDIDITTI